MGSYSQVFGGSSIRPSQPGYLALTIAANTTLVWPLESQAGGNSVASQIDVIASAGSLSILMPPANQGSLGIATMMTNVGSNTFALNDNSGNLIANIAASQSFIISLTDNTSVAGVWRSYQLAATTSTANAAALAGNGLQALLTQLQTIISTRYTSAAGNIVSGDRAFSVIWQGGTANLTLDTIANLTAGWWCFVSNQGTGAVTVKTSGSDTINGVASITIPAPPAGAKEYYSALIACSASGFNVIMYGSPDVIPITGGGTGAVNASNALTNLGGSAVGISIFTAPTLAAVLALLGLVPVTITESTISASQALLASSSAKAFVATAALTLTLPLTTTLSTSYFFFVFAQGGNVTLTPNSADAINGTTAGTSFTVLKGGSLAMMTDAAGNWWPFFYALPPGTFPVTVVTSGVAYTVLSTDYTVVIKKTVGSATTVNLPASPNTGHRVEIKDGKGDAATNPITVTTTDGTLIDGATNYFLNFAYECENFEFDGTAWGVMS